MKLSFITPTAYIKDYGSQGDFMLALAHLIDLEKENEYERSIKETKLPIMLDNSCFEKDSAEPIDSLIKKGIKVGAYVFFAPDVMFNSKETKKELMIAIEKVKEQKADIQIGAIVQGDNKEDFMRQLVEFNDLEEVSLIGIPIKPCGVSFNLPIAESRIELMKEMLKMEEQGFKWKKMHLLGLGDSYKDVIFAKDNCPWIESNDSSSAFQTGLANCSYNADLEVVQGKVKEKVDFSLDNVYQGLLDDIDYHIKKIKSVIQK
jgi:hypothetical protein